MAAETVVVVGKDERGARFEHFELVACSEMRLSPALAPTTPLPLTSTTMYSRPPFEERMQPDGDAAIRQTDSDAALARWSAVQKHYLIDPFLKPLLPRGAHLQHPRPPLINVGTYVRSEGIDNLVGGWLQCCAEEGKPCQVVSFGAGSDTRFWRIAVRTFLPIQGPKGMEIAEHLVNSGRLGLVRSN